MKEQTMMIITFLFSFRLLASDPTIFQKEQDYPVSEPSSIHHQLPKDLGDLHQCAEQNIIWKCRQLLIQGESLETKNTHGQTPFLTAVASGSFETAAYLFAQGAEVNATDKRGRGAMHLAVSSHHYGQMKRLQRMGVDINQLDKKGWSPIFLATATGQYRHLEILLKMKANGNTKEWITGMNPLMMASWMGHDFMVKKLLRTNGISKSATDMNGNSAVHFAADQDNLKVLRALKRHGLNPLIKNDDNKTPLDIAKENQNSKVIQFLTDWN